MGSLALADRAGFPSVKPFDEDEARHRREIAVVLNNAMQGKLNVVGSLTLTSNVATTTLTDSRLGPNSTVLLMPTTANAATALANVYFTAVTAGSCTVNHANNAQVDRVFKFSVIG